MSTNMLNTEKGQSFLPPPAIFLSEATSDGEDTGDDKDQIPNQGPRLVKCEAVLTDVEYSSDEETVEVKCIHPIAVNCSSESQVIERIYDPKYNKLNDELTDTENLNISDDELINGFDEEKEDTVLLYEDGVTTIADKFKTQGKAIATKNVLGKKPCMRNKSGTENSNGKNFLAPVTKMGKKKKKKGKLLLESCLTDTEDVDIPSDIDDNTRVSKKDVSYTLFPSEQEEQEYTNRIKHSSNLRGMEKCTLVEFLTNKVEEDGVTDTDDLAYSDCEDLLESFKEIDYEIDFSNEVKNKETFFLGPLDRKMKKKRNIRNTPENIDSDEEESEKAVMSGQKSRSHNQSGKNNTLSIRSYRECKTNNDDMLSALTDTEDINYSDGECDLSRPKCPTPEMILFENSTVFQNESMQIMQALEVINDIDPLTDCEELLLSSSPRRQKGMSVKKMKNLIPCVKISGEGLTDTEELLFSETDINPILSDVSDTGADSCSETDIEVHSNIGDIEDVRRRAPSITPECLRNLDNTYISNIEGSEAYLKQIKCNKSRSLSGPPVICTVSPSPILGDTDSEDMQTSADETAEEYNYNRACTPSNFYEKFNLDEESCVIHEKNTRSFQTDGEESLHIKDQSYQLDPVTDSEEVELLD